MRIDYLFIQLIDMVTAEREVVGKGSTDLIVDVGCRI